MMLNLAVIPTDTDMDMDTGTDTDTGMDTDMGMGITQMIKKLQIAISLSCSGYSANLRRVLENG